MIIFKTNLTVINNALIKINKKFDNNVCATKIKNVSYEKGINRYKFHLVSDYKDKIGARIDYKDNFSCIHVYHDFFDIVLNEDSNAVILVCEEWVIKKDKNNKIVNNRLCNYPNDLHIIKESSFECNCSDINDNMWIKSGIK